MLSTNGNKALFFLFNVHAQNQQEKKQSYLWEGIESRKDRNMGKNIYAVYSKRHTSVVAGQRAVHFRHSTPAQHPRPTAEEHSLPCHDRRRRVRGTQHCKHNKACLGTTKAHITSLL